MILSETKSSTEVSPKNPLRTSLLLQQQTLRADSSVILGRYSTVPNFLQTFDKSALVLSGQ